MSSVSISLGRSFVFSASVLCVTTVFSGSSSASTSFTSAFSFSTVTSGAGRSLAGLSTSTLLSSLGSSGPLPIVYGGYSGFGP